MKIKDNPLRQEVGEAAYISQYAHAQPEATYILSSPHLGHFVIIELLKDWAITYPRRRCGYFTLED
jgi:hypothetical protein